MRPAITSGALLIVCRRLAPHAIGLQDSAPGFTSRIKIRAGGLNSLGWRNSASHGVTEWQLRSGRDILPSD